MYGFGLCKWMMELHTKDGNNIHAHLDTLHHMHKQLVGMNTIPTANDYSITILSSLPSTCNQDLFSLTATAQLSNKTLSPDEIIAHTLELYDLLKLKFNGSGGVRATLQQCHSYYLLWLYHRG